ncbi:MAG: hypothetical protein V1839_00800 [archaeon]
MALENILQTTVIGSYPLVEAEEHVLTNQDAAIDAQLNVGVKVISDGQPRFTMIDYVACPLESFHRNLEGKWEITDDITDKTHTDPVVHLWDDFKHVIGRCEWRTKVDGKTTEPAYMMAGPLTMAWSMAAIKNGIYGKNPKETTRNPKLYLDIAKAEYALYKLIDPNFHAASFHIDEPFFSQGIPFDAVKDAIEYLAEKISSHGVPVTLHSCGNITGMARENDKPVRLFEKLLELKYISVLSHGFTGTKEMPNREILSKYKVGDYKKKLGLGCASSSSTDIESPESICEFITEAVKLQGIENLVLNPDCGLRELPVNVAYAKLENMCEARKLYLRETGMII